MLYVLEECLTIVCRYVLVRFANDIELIIDRSGAFGQGPRGGGVHRSAASHHGDRYSSDDLLNLFVYASNDDDLYLRRPKTMEADPVEPDVQRDQVHLNRTGAITSIKFAASFYDCSCSSRRRR